MRCTIIALWIVALNSLRCSGGTTSRTDFIENDVTEKVNVTSNNNERGVDGSTKEKEKCKCDPNVEIRITIALVSAAGGVGALPFVIYCIYKHKCRPSNNSTQTSPRNTYNYNDYSNKVQYNFVGHSPNTMNQLESLEYS